jgi:hypothetical protein
VFPDTEVKIPSTVAVRLKVARVVESETRLRRRRQIRCSADQPRDVLRNVVEQLPGDVTHRQAFRIGRELR